MPFWGRLAQFAGRPRGFLLRLLVVVIGCQGFSSVKLFGFLFSVFLFSVVCADKDLFHPCMFVGEVRGLGQRVRVPIQEDTFLSERQVILVLFLLGVCFVSFSFLEGRKNSAGRGRVPLVFFSKGILNFPPLLIFLFKGCWSPPHNPPLTHSIITSELFPRSHTHCPAWSGGGTTSNVRRMRTAGGFSLSPTVVLGQF